jgi:hypothetical protein
MPEDPYEVADDGDPRLEGGRFDGAFHVGCSVNVRLGCQ